MKYLDTVVEDVERIKKGRENINKGIMLSLIFLIIIGLMACVLFSLSLKATAIFLLVIGVMYLIVLSTLVIKREIYGIMIYLKQKENKK